MIGGLNLNDTNCARHVQALQEAHGLEFFRGMGVVSLKHEGCCLNVTGVQTLESKVPIWNSGASCIIVQLSVVASCRCPAGMVETTTSA